MPTCGTETHPFSSHPTIDTTTQARAAPGVHIGQPAPKTALKTSHKVLNKPAEFLGSDGPACRERGSVVNRHESPWHVTNLRFWPAISEPGWTSRKKSSHWTEGGAALNYTSCTRAALGLC